MKNTALYWWWLRRRTAGRPPARNPLCRPSDRLQQISAWTWFIAAVLSIPIIGIAVLPGVADSWSAPAMRPVSAVVEHVAKVPLNEGPFAGPYIRRQYQVRVRWTTDTGDVQHSSVKVPDQPHQGATIRVWTTQSGDRVAGSQLRSTRVVDMIFLLAMTAVSACLLGYGAHRLLVWRLDRRRLLSWDVGLAQFLTRH